MWHNQRLELTVKNLQSYLICHPLITLAILLSILLTGLFVSPFESSFLPSDLRMPIAVDAIPDLGENQQIVFTSWMGRSPQDIEDQISYPLSTQLMGLPGVKSIRTFSFLGFSTIYVIFNEDVEFYWSRSRIIEKLNSLPNGLLPSGVQATLGPDATPLGQIYLYMLQAFDQDGNRVPQAFNLEEKRTIQDFQAKPLLQSISGVSEVASIGGFVKEYQVQLDPQKLAFYKISLLDVAKSIKTSNLDIGAKTMEYNKVEYLIRGLGFVKDQKDIENTVVKTDAGTPLLIKHLGHVQLVPGFRRGILDDAGEEAVGGIVVARYGENPMKVLADIRSHLKKVNDSFPSKTLKNGKKVKLKIVPYYDRTNVIQETIATLWHALTDEMIIASLVILAFLFHTGSSFLLAIILPFGILLTFIGMKIIGIEANVVALSGIAIAIGVMGDMGIVLVENTQKMLEENPDEKSSLIILKAVSQVNMPILIAASTTIISFLPVFFLTGAEGKLFRPLAYTKTLAILSAVLISLFLLPPLSRYLQALKLKKINKFLAIPIFVLCLCTITYTWSPLGNQSGYFFNLFFVSLVILSLLISFSILKIYYLSILKKCLNYSKTFLFIPITITMLGMTIWLGVQNVFFFLPDSILSSTLFMSYSKKFPGLGSEFMPKLKEGSFLYMPTSMPHASGEEMTEVLSILDQKIASVPEVEWAVGKAGRAASALDPAPMSMIETIIQYHSEFKLDKDGNQALFSFDSKSNQFIRDQNNLLINDSNGKPYRNWRKHIKTPQDIWDEIIKVSQIPGTTSAPFLQPIEARLVMLQSGMRAPMGIKIIGDDLQTMEQFGLYLEKTLKEVTGVKSSAVFSDRIVGKPYLEVDWNREELARYGISILEAQRHLEWGVGGGKISEVIDGRNRFALSLRFLKDYRDSPEDLEKLLISPSGGHTAIPLSLLAKVHYRKGPQAIKGEDSKLVSYVLFDKDNNFSEGEVIQSIQEHFRQKQKSGEFLLPPGTFYKFAGSYQNQLRANKRLAFIIPLALIIIFFIISLQFNSIVVTGFIFSAVLQAWSGGFILIWLYNQDWFFNFALFGYHFREIFQVNTIYISVAVWVGFLALFGIATDDGVLMSSFISQELKNKVPKSKEDLKQTILAAAQKRVRACLMTSATTILALLPILTNHGRGSEIMIPMAVPIFGGMCVALLSLFLTPVLFYLYHSFTSNFDKNSLNDE
ncbi:MAG: efflux RND transporter permease subunit [Candidatus Cloacimonetes bacterium]|nr:efflux RND transporter permease subunit [Candidatus Cloacimonadota bacterium]